jgi:hypothetical protein
MKPADKIPEMEFNDYWSCIQDLVIIVVIKF